QLAPEKHDYHVFYLKHNTAFWVATKLEDYFAGDDKKKKEGGNFFFYAPPADKPEARRLSKRKNLKFITESDTNTILVLGADASQLKTIEDLIKLYDQPDPINSKTARVTVTFTLKYSKAKAVADAVKDVYRDLLSSN